MDHNALSLEPDGTMTAVDTWAARIRPHLAAAVENIVDAGRQLIAAKEALDHGDFLSLVKSLDLRPRTAQKFMAIARHELISNAPPGTHLPTSWTTLYELSRAPGDLLEQAFIDGKVTSDMSRKDAVQLVARLQEGRTHQVDHVQPDLSEAGMSGSRPATLEERLRRHQWELGAIAAGFIDGGGDIACLAETMLTELPPVWSCFGFDGPVEWVENCICIVALYPEPDFDRPWDDQPKEPAWIPS